MNQYSTPPGWYPDGDGWERRWDGSAWTDERRRTGGDGDAGATRARPGTGPEPGSGWAPPVPPAAPTGLAPGSGSGSGWSGPNPASSGGAPSSGPAQPAGGYGQVPGPSAPGWGPPGGYPSGPQGPGSHPGAPAGPGYGSAPGYGSGAGYGSGYGYGAPPARKSRRLGLWIALAVVLVLVIGAGVTVAVLQPWDDGGTTTTVTADPETISGDFDGDGLGDVELGVGTRDTVRLVEGHSTGDSFETTELAGDPYAVPLTVAVDTNADGSEERVVAAYDESAGTLSLTSSDEGLAEFEPARIRFSMLASYGVLEVRLAPGDFDGDGTTDLAVYGQADRKVDVHVMTGDGDGGFASPELWASLPNALMNAVRLQAGDFDGDGDDDLFAELPGEQLDNDDYDSNYFIGDKATAQLTSSGEGFEVGETTVDETYGATYLVADLGAETDRVLSLQSSPYDEELAISGFEVVDGRLLADDTWNIVESVGETRLLAATVSDVDGDGDEDVVYVQQADDGVTVGDLTVVVAGEDGFTAGATWGAAADCPEEYCTARFY